MDANVTALVSALSRAATFEAAAFEALRALLRLADSSLSRSAYVGKATLLRGMVHLRPDDGYTRLVVLEPGATAPTATPRSLPSATAWRWAKQGPRTLFIDVTAGTVEAGDLQGELAGDSQPFNAGESQARLLDRDATHLLVLPMHAPGGVVAGMLSLEARCTAAIGKTSPFALEVDRVRLVVDVASPFLTALPVTGTPQPTDEYLPVIGASMAGLIEMLGLFARQEETLLLRGPTGAGKSRLARWCHERSPRSSAPFEVLNLSTVPADLQMAKIFGHRRGAFTGAVSDSAGCVARAEGGTLFIDEIDKLSLEAQASLLQLLEERRYRPIGDAGGDRTTDVRFIVGTNADLAAAIREGRFREDLFFRINVLPIKVPPLAERTDEIGDWATHMLQRRVGRSDVGLSNAVARLLALQPWPGNLRQLDNIVRRAYTLALLDGAPPHGPLTLEVRHVERALALDEVEAPGSLVERLQNAAIAFVAEAERRKSQGASLDLDHADAFRGFVLAVAIDKLQSQEAAMELLNKSAVIQNRNVQRVLRRELDRVDALYQLLGVGKSPFDFGDPRDG